MNTQTLAINGTGNVMFVSPATDFLQVYNCEQIHDKQGDIKNKLNSILLFSFSNT
ncbi:hypothetical protein [Niastella vici]|uniref:hypothetical protein n=1 Tax=Niastella vici TaxID=1703345 RepID=UPI001301B7E5|nr:hypothetical protein [Niastella vici]